MKLVSKVVALLLFVLFFAFALKNTHEVVLVLFFKYELQAPLVLMLLGFFVAGAVLGVLAMSPIVFRHRRELARHKKNLHHLQHENRAAQQARTQPPQPDTVVAQ